MIKEMNREIHGVIYLVINKENNKIYVGQTERTFDARYRGDISNTHNIHLSRAIKKYGKDAFYINKEYDVAYSKEELDELEKYYIGMFESMNPSKGYNKEDGGSNGRPSEETCKRIGESMTGKFSGELSPMYGKTGELHPMYGKENKWGTHTPEAIAKISEGRKKYLSNQENRKRLSDAHKGKKLSKETRTRISENHGMRGKTGALNPSSIKIVELSKTDGQLLNIWNSMSDIDRAIGKKVHSAISCVCQGKRKTCNGSLWMYMDNYRDLVSMDAELTAILEQILTGVETEIEVGGQA